MRVDGAPSWDEARLSGILSTLQGVPCAMVRARAIESEVLEEAGVRSSHLDRNLFGSAVLKVGYRQPVAVLADRPSMALAIDGALYSSEHIPAPLPTVRLEGDEPTRVLTIASGRPLVGIANLAVRVRELRLTEPVLIDFGNGGVVCLNIGEGRVILGSCDDLDTKLKALQRLLARDPAVLSKVKALNLTVVAFPTVVPKVAGDKE